MAVPNGKMDALIGKRLNRASVLLIEVTKRV